MYRFRRKCLEKMKLNIAITETVQKDTTPGSCRSMQGIILTYFTLKPVTAPGFSAEGTLTSASYVPHSMINKLKTAKKKKYGKTDINFNFCVRGTAPRI